MVAVIDGAVKASFSAIICLIIACNCVRKSCGVLAIIVGLQSGSPAFSQEPILAKELNNRIPFAFIPPP